MKARDMAVWKDNAKIAWRMGVGAFVLMSAACALAAGTEGLVRRMSAAGVFYPAEADALRDRLTALFDAAPAPPEGRLVACISPHSGYEFAGAVEAAAFKGLHPGDFDRVIILAPSHLAALEGCSIPAVDALATPLGLVPLDGPAVRRLCQSPLIEARSLRYRESRGRSTQIHETEYSIEVILPFLQERLGTFTLIPILVGSMNDARGEFNANICEVVADAIRPLLNARTLLVISTDFTHYGNDFSFRPFKDDVITNIEYLDKAAFHFLLQHDFKGFHRYLEESKNPICGKEALLVFLKLLPARAEGVLLEYETSAKLTQNMTRSVSYAALNFYATAEDRQNTTGAARPAPKVLRLKGNARQANEWAALAEEEEESWDGYEVEFPADEGDVASPPLPETAIDTPAQEVTAPPPASLAAIPPGGAMFLTPQTETPSSPTPSPPPAPAPVPAVETPLPATPILAPPELPPNLTQDGNAMVFTPKNAASVQPVPQPAPDNGGGEGPVVIRMKGTRDSQEPIVEMQGTPENKGTQGRAGFAGTPEELRRLTSPAGAERVSPQQEPATHE